jgi:hypothetical protein
MLVLIRWQGRSIAVPLFQLAAVDPDESRDEAIGDWQPTSGIMFPLRRPSTIFTSEASGEHLLIEERSEMRCWGF